MKTTLFRLLSLKGQVFAPGRWLLILFLCHATAASAAIDGTFTVTETWSVTLSYRDFANGVTRTDRSTGTLTGKLRIADGQYDVIDRIGLPWESPGRDLKGRSLTYNGFSYNIEGDYVFAPAYGSRAYGLVFLGCFAVKVPLVDGEVPIFYDYETYSASGSSLDAMHGGGNMIGSSLKVYVSSTISLREVVGPPQISQQPRSQSLFEGQSATFSVAAGGREPLGYFWRKGGAPLPGANGASLTVTNLQLSDVGAYSVVVTNAGGMVTSAAAQLTVKLPPPPWFEGWESATVGRYAPSSNAVVSVAGDRGRWVVADTVSFFPECFPIGNHADIVTGNGRKSLRLFSVPNSGPCAENISVDFDGPLSSSFPIPLLPASEVSFFAQGAMVNPLWNGFFQCISKPCGDTTHLRITDDHNNQVLYILQRAPNYVEHALTNGPSNFGYREIFLDPAGGTFTRNLYADLASIAGSAGVGTAVVGVEFALASAGWAELDDLRIGTTSGTSDTIKPTVTIAAPANRARLFSPTVTLTGTAGDNTAVERVEVRVGDGVYQNAIGAAKWTAMLDLTPGTNVIRARARDTSGNYSTEAVWSLVQVVTSPLALMVGPGGKVTGATNGQALEVGRAYTMTAVPDAGYRFTRWSGDVASTNPVLAFVMQSNLVVRVEFIDVARPVVAVTAPVNGTRTNRAVIAVRGKATDNGVVNTVLFQLNETPYAPAEGTTNWETSVALEPGTNVFRVRCVDTAGNESQTVTNRYVYVVTSPLSLVVGPGGKVTGATNGQALEVGRAYTMTAVPDAGYRFTRWSGDVASTNPVLAFVMQSNLVVRVEFIDVARPVVAVTAPVNGTRTNRAVIAVRGKATDNGVVNTVLFQLNETPYAPAEGTTNWETSVALEPGTNVFRVRCVDTAGNESQTVTNRYVYVVTSPLSLVVGPGGKVTGATNGQALEVGRAYTMTAVPDAGYRFTRWSGDVASTNPVLAFVMQSNLVVRVEFIDVARPVVAVTAPVNGTRTNRAVIAVRGKATDNGVVETVVFALNGSPYAPAEGTTNWQAAVTLEPGTNVFRVRCVDAAGNESTTVTNRYVHVVTSPLTLVCPGGKVLGATNRQALEVGRAYALTAVPDAGFLFSNWTGGVLSSANPLRFVMTSNLVVEANFVPNPFLLVAGQFNGLFRNPSVVEHGSSGAFKAAVQGSGAFSATFQTGARRMAFAGRFDLDGKSTNIVARRGTNALTVELWLKFDGSEEMSGRVTDGLWSSELLADRAVFSAIANPATNFARQYTLLIPGGTNGSVMEPAGDGFAAVTVSRAGLTTIKGTLADGTPAVLAVPVSKGGDVPLYLSLYGGAGSASGWLRVLPSSEIDLNGELAWFKPARPVPAIYTNGFALGLPVAGSIYTPFGTNRLFDAEMASVVFTEGGLMGAFTNVVTLGPSGRVTLNPPNKFTLRAVSATGLFSGTVLPPEGTKPVPFKGALLQRQGYGGGFFLNAGQSGRVWLGP